MNHHPQYSLILLICRRIRFANVYLIPNWIKVAESTWNIYKCMATAFVLCCVDANDCGVAGRPGTHDDR